MCWRIHQVTNSTSPLCVFERVAPILFPLVNRFYKRSGYPVSCGRLEQVYCLRGIIAGVSTILAAARFLPHDSQYYLLRNLCVDQQWRQRGCARMLMQNALEKLRPSACYCFAQANLRGFYESLGFVVLVPENAPAEIARRYQGYSKSQPGLLLLGFDG